MNADALKFPRRTMATGAACGLLLGLSLLIPGLPVLAFGILFVNLLLIVGGVAWYDWRTYADLHPTAWFKPRSGMLYVVTGEWPRYGMMYHGGKVTNGLAMTLMQNYELIGIRLEQYVIEELTRLYNIRPTLWANIDRPGNFPRGSWVIVIHGDPGAVVNGPDFRQTIPLTDNPAAIRPEPFWVELVIIDKTTPVEVIVD